MTRRALIGMLIACGGCFSWGTPPDKFPPALGPEGARVALRVRGESADRLGELLAVDSTGITIRGDRVITVAWPKVAALDVKDVGLDYDIVMGEPVSPEKIARLALLSRFPQGMRRVPVAIDSLIAATSGGIERFKDRRVASAEGYRRVGADFPGMGEHWLNVGMLLKNEIDPTRPTLLAYATIHGQPTLLGAGYIVVTRDGEPPPDVPGWPAEWHEHSGLLSDESSGLHDAHHSHSETHMWVMHVWTALPNPSGPLAADNWALPFVRAGVPAPRDVSADAGHAASLIVGGDTFLEDALADANLRTADNAAAVDSAIALAAQRASRLMLGAATDSLPLVWRDLAASLERKIGPGVRPLFAAEHK